MVYLLPYNGRFTQCWRFAMFERNIRHLLIKALSRSRVVLLTGARQSGKTTLIKSIGNEFKYHFATFDDLRALESAKKDPMGFIENLNKPVILDEVQRVPEIFLPIKYDVDNHNNFGRYALTGSTNPLLIPKLGDSLSGRMEIINMLPLSQGELLGVQENFIDRVFNNEIPRAPLKTLSKRSLYEKILAGGYPMVQGLTTDDRDAWFNSYITTLVQRDVQDIANITNIREFSQLLRLLATRVGNLLNVAELSRSSGIPAVTLHRYLALLEACFIVKFLPAWSQNFGKRLVKSPKTYLIDTGLLSFLIGINTERLLNDSILAGGIVENFVVEEIIKQLTWSSTYINLFHFRTANGIEVDLILEDRAGNIIGIEIKSSETVDNHDFKGLNYLKEIMGEKFLRGIVLYPGSLSVPFGDKLIALPIETLWTRDVG